MRIHADFPGGNITVNRVEGDDVYVEQQIRDTMEWWFYWAFCVEGAQGRTVTFHFENRDVVGYWGPSVSADDWHYEWAGASARVDGHTFVHTFGPAEDRVYFRYATPYHLNRFDRWAAVQHFPLQRQVLCVSERGRDVPYYVMGKPDAPRSIYFTSRHHACESVATFALEGACAALMRNPALLDARRCNLIAVPFVDLDGVEDGDQGKARSPHDHNRDYIDAPIYAVTRALESLVKRHPPLAFVDFHCPWFLGSENDHMYVVKSDPEEYPKLDRFSELLIRRTAADPAKDAIRYTGLHDIRAGEKWVPSQKNPATSSSFFSRQGTAVSISLEVPYFGIDVPFTAANVERLGGHIALAMMDMECIKE